MIAILTFLTRDQRQQVKDLAEKYGLPTSKLMERISSDLLKGDLGFDAVMICWRLFLSEKAGADEVFTVEDVMAATSESYETVMKATDQMRSDAALRGENPDDYAYTVGSESVLYIPNQDYKFKDIDGEQTAVLSMRGSIKMAYLARYGDEGGSPDNVKGHLVMNEFYKLCESKQYGQPWKKIRDEVNALNKHAAVRWIERVFENYVTNEDIVDIFQRVQ